MPSGLRTSHARSRLGGLVWSDEGVGLQACVALWVLEVGPGVSWLCVCTPCSLLSRLPCSDGRPTPVLRR